MRSTHPATPQAVLSDALIDVVTPRTLEILDRRRRRSVVRRRGWLVRRALMLADIVGLSVAFAVTQAVFSGHASIDRVNRYEELFLFALTLPAWVVAARLYGLYSGDEVRADHSTADDLTGVFQLVSVGAWALFSAGWLTKVVEPDLRKLALFWALAIVLVTASRIGARAVARQSVAYIQNTVIVGGGPLARSIARKLQQHPEYGLNLVGFVDHGPSEADEEVAALGSLEDLPSLAQLLDIERVIVVPSDDQTATIHIMRQVMNLDVQVDLVPSMYELISPNLGIHTVEGVPMIALPPHRLSRSAHFAKRAMDASVAGTALVLLSPLFALVAMLIKVDSRGPVFFRQLRMGERDREFLVFKFRTMDADADARRDELRHLNVHTLSGDGRLFKVPDDPRVTPVGRFLRRYFLDELPQLINVLRGEMSLVGPRPLVIEEDRLVSPWARKRLHLKPGMTGVWQVLGGANLSFEEMIRLDYQYVTTWSLGHDLRLLAQTIPLMLRGGGGSY